MVGLRRTRTGLWAARKEIPKDVRAAYGKREENPGRAEDWWSAREELEPEDPEDREAGRIKPTPWLVAERDALLASRGLLVRGHSAQALLEEMGDLWLSLCHLMERRADGDYGPDLVEATLPAFGEPHAAKPAPAAVSIKQLFSDYEATGTASPATIKKWRGVINTFVDFLGHDDAAAVAVQDVDRWTRSLIAKSLSVKSVRDGYLVAVSVIMRDAVSRGLIPSNPAAGVQVRGPKTEALRSKSLTDNEAETIVKAALGPHPTSLSPRYALARRWVPWVQAYTGARVNEISQLRAMDIREEQGVWIIHITPEAGPIKNGKARSVPIHPHLIEQGFHKLGRAGDPPPLFYDPSAHRGGKDGNPQSKKVGERLAQWVRSLGVEGVAPNHGWRHRFKTVARAVGMDPEARDAIQGHATRTEGQAYGDWPLEVGKRLIHLGLTQ